MHSVVEAARINRWNFAGAEPQRKRAAPHLRTFRGRERLPAYRCEDAGVEPALHHALHKRVRALEREVVNPFPVEDVAEIESRRTVFGIQVKAVRHQVGGVLNGANLVQGVRERVIPRERKALGSALGQADQKGMVSRFPRTGAEKNALREVVIKGR